MPIDVKDIIEQIRGQLDGSDSKIYDFVLSFYEPEGPCEEFYRKASESRNSFVREYFKSDLGVRNAKVEYLNKALGRPEGRDLLRLSDEEFERKNEVDTILSGTDILAREHGLDEFMWTRAEELTLMHVFDLDIILAFTVRLKIVDRWMRLDENAGRAMFRKLANELRNSKNK